MDLLQEDGYTYCMDWGSLDDQPLWMKTRSGGKILAVPYAMELNDYPVSPLLAVTLAAPCGSASLMLCS